MKKQFPVKVLLLSLVTLTTFSPHLYSQVKKDGPGSHIRTVGGDNRFAGETTCPTNPLSQQDVINLTLHVVGPASPPFVWPTFCDEVPRIAVYQVSVGNNILLGYSDPITTFQPDESIIGAEMCEGGNYRAIAGHSCPNLYHVNVSIPISFPSPCSPVQNCELITLEYRLIGDTRDEDNHYASRVSIQCYEALFPDSCFCHTEDTDTGQSYVLQDVWYNCKNANARTSSNSAIQSANLAPVSFSSKASNSSEAIQVFPNPVTDQLTLNFPSWQPEDTEIHIFDDQGKLVLNTYPVAPINDGTWQIPMGHLSPGIYFCRIRTSQKSITKKIAKLK